MSMYIYSLKRGITRFEGSYYAPSANISYLNVCNTRVLGNIFLYNLFSR